MTFSWLVEAVRRRFGLLVRYGISGALGAFIQTFALYVWIDVLGFHSTYLWGAFFGFCLALIVSFILQKYWTFRDHSNHRTHTQLLWYGAVALVNVAVNILLLALAKEVFYMFGIDFFAGWYIAVQIAIVIFASAVSFVLNYFFTFKGAISPLEESLQTPPEV